MPLPMPLPMHNGTECSEIVSSHENFPKNAFRDQFFTKISNLPLKKSEVVGIAASDAASDALERKVPK